MNVADAHVGSVVYVRAKVWDGRYTGDRLRVVTKAIEGKVHAVHRDAIIVWLETLDGSLRVYKPEDVFQTEKDAIASDS